MSKPVPIVHEGQTERHIKTVYYRKGVVLKVNHSATAINAVPRCIYHMQLDRYEARTAEVYDGSDGTLHAVITRSMHGNISIIFKREVKENM